MPQMCRITDVGVGVCLCHETPQATTGLVITGSLGTLANGLGVARSADILLSFCGHVGIIVTSSPDTTADNRGIARVGDIFAGCFNGVMITGSPNVVVN